MTPFDEMVEAKKAQINAIPGTLVSTLLIPLEDAQRAWLDALVSDWRTITLMINGMPASWTMPLEDSAGYVAVCQILRENNLHPKLTGE